MFVGQDAYVLIISKVESPIEQEVYVKKVAEYSDVSEAAIKREINKILGKKNEEFIDKIYREKWIPLPFHDEKIMNQYRKLSANIVQVI